MTGILCCTYRYELTLDPFSLMWRTLSTSLAAFRFKVFSLRPWPTYCQALTIHCPAWYWYVRPNWRSPLQRVKLCFHRNSSFLVSTEIVTFYSKELWQINFSICWCWRWLQWRDSGNIAMAEDYNLPISLLSSLTVTFSLTRISWQWLSTFEEFLLR